VSVVDTSHQGRFSDGFEVTDGSYRSVVNANRACGKTCRSHDGHDEVNIMPAVAAFAHRRERPGSVATLTPAPLVKVRRQAFQSSKLMLVLIGGHGALKFARRCQYAPDYDEAGNWRT
jgi:hypothetical protein